MSKIVHKKSAVVGKVPLTADLDYGELAINYADGFLYYKASNNTVQKIKADLASGSGLSTWQAKTSNYTAVSGDRLLANTSGGSFTITLPASPSLGDQVVVADPSDWGVNGLTIARNGSTIEGLAENFVLDVKGVDATLVYDGTTWQVFSSLTVTGGGVVPNRQIFTATANQTTFTVSYLPQYIDVYLNGVKLVNGQDFVATNSTTVVLSVGAAQGDLVEVVAGIWMDAGVVDFANGTVLGQLAIASGGTGASTAQAAFNNLAPSQVGNSGKYLTTNGTNTSWAAIDALPSQTGNSGKYLKTNGTVASWDQIEINTADITGTLPTANGGTGLASFTSGGLVYATSSSALATGSALQFDGSTLNTTGAFRSTGLSVPASGTGVEVTWTGSTGVVLAYNRTASSWQPIEVRGSTALLQADTSDATINSISSSLIFKASNTEGMRLTTTGLGIGTSSPSYKLNVVGTNAGTTGLFQVGISGVTNGFSINTDASNNITYSFLTGGQAQGLYQGASGSVGIGTSSPNKKFHVNGDIQASNAIWFSPINTNTIYGVTFANAGAMGFEAYQGTYIYWGTGAGASATERMRLDASGNFGIGTSSPSYKLDVAGSAARIKNTGGSADLILSRASSGAGATISLNTGDTNKWYFGLRGLVDDNFYIVNNILGTTAMIINTSSNVGIGTDSPGSKLDISGSNAGSVLESRILNTSTSASSDARQFIYVNGGTAGDPYTIWTVGGVTSWTAGIRNSDSDKWYLSPGSSLATSPSIVVTTGGSLGIGNTSPTTTLSIGTSAGSGGYGGGVYLNRGPGVYNFYEASDGTNSVIFGFDHLVPNVKIGTVNSYPVGFYTGNNERMRITSGGELLVGTTSNSWGIYGGFSEFRNDRNSRSLLTVSNQNSGSAGAAGILLAAYGNSWVQAIGTTANNSNALTWSVDATSPSEKMRLTTSGSLLIGATGTPVASAKVKIRTPSRTGTFFDLDATGGENWIIDSTNTVGSTDVLGIYAYGVTGLYIQDTGNIGIGTSSPITTLQVNAGAPTIRLEETTTGGSKRLELGVTSGGLAYIGANQSAQDLVFQTVGSERMRITSVGAIGIGTTSPSETIFVQTPSTYGTNYIAFSDRTTLTSGDSDAGGIKWYDYGGAAASIGFKHNAYFGSAPRAITFNISGSERARITNSGYLGIGTTSPLAPLVVCSPNNENIEFGVGNVGLNGGYIEYINRNTASTRPDFNFYIANSSGSHKFYTTATERLRINANGNVGIGTSNPTSRLHVVSEGNTTADSKAFYLEGGTHTGQASPNNMQYGLFVTQGGARYTSQCGIYSVVGESRPNNNGSYGGQYYGIQGIAEVSTQAWQQGTGVYGQSGSINFNYSGKQIGVQGVCLPGYTTFSNTYGLSYTNGGFGGHFVAHGKADSCGVYADAYLDASPGAGVLARPLVCGTNGSFIMYVMTNGGIANYSSNDTNLSDIREKRNVQLAPNYLDKICAIPIKTFRYNNEDDTADITLGVIAQDVQAVAPEFVTEDSWPTPDEPDRKRLSVYQTDLQFAMMKCIQELNTKLDVALAKIAELEAKQ